MSKAKRQAAEELRPEYKRSDFGALVRGKYVEQLQASSNIVVIDPAISDLFPNAAAVNAAFVFLGGHRDEGPGPAGPNREVIPAEMTS